MSQDSSVRLTCICTDVQTHRNLIRVCDYVNSELQYCHQVLSLLQSRGLEYQLPVSKIDPKIQADGYEPWLDLTFHLDREGILHLLRGSRLYPGPGDVLKELVLNAVDATRQAVKLGKGPSPIAVAFNSQTCELSVNDCGIGMNETDVRQFLLQLGKSIYHSAEYEDRYTEHQRIDSLSQFGIGLASCFLAADHVVVETKRKGEDSILLDMYDLTGFCCRRVKEPVRIRVRKLHYIYGRKY